MAAATAEYLKDGKIHRNIIYSIDATLAGRGYDDPTVPPTDFVELFVKTKVLDWGSANQSSVSNNIYSLNNVQKAFLLSEVPFLHV